MNQPKSNRMVRVGIMALIANVSLTAYCGWQLHVTHDQGYRALGFMFAVAGAAWTVGLMIWNAVQKQEN